MRDAAVHPTRLAWARRALLALLLLAAAGCASLPENVQRTPSSALPGAPDTPLGRIARASTVDPEQSGFRLLPTGQFALQARLELARRAVRTLDVQYYQIHDDQTGRYLLRTLRDAAQRGVRVRLLMDDLYTSGADPLLLGLAAHPNVELRLFNPFPGGRTNFASRFAASLHEFSRVHRRMHNKLFIADGVMAVAGGRNIGDEYFMVSAGANFVDLDTLVVGALLPRLGELFDGYWNSPRVYPIEAIVKSDVAPEERRRHFERVTSPLYTPEPVGSPFLDGDRSPPPRAPQAADTAIATPEPEPPPPNDLLGYAPVSVELAAGKLGLIWADARAYADAPDKVIGRVSTYGGAPIDDVDSVGYNVVELVRRARKEVVITSPYLVPGRDGIAMMRETSARGAKFTLVTNALAATDEPVVHTGYRRYRPEMLEIGVELYELSPLRTSRSLRLGRFSTSIGRLHAKSAIIDNEKVFIGSMNFDPRSARHNTEMGLFIQSPALAQQMRKLVEVVRQQGAYHVRLAPDGKGLQWLASGPGGQEQLVEEPETDFWSRLMLEVLSWLVPEDLL
jgi:cardiolipin synthase C